MGGLTASFIAALFSTTRDLVSKRVSASVDGVVSACASFLFALPYYAALLFILWLIGMEEFAISKAFFVLVLLRSLTDAFAEWLKMRALALGEISLVSPFFSLSPLFLLVTSPLITGDTVSTNGIFAILLVVAGTLIVGYTPKTIDSLRRSNWPAIWTAVGSAFFLSLNSCFDRLAVQVASPAFSGAAMTLVAAIFLLPFCLQARKRQQFASEARWFSVRGFFEVGFMVLKLYALQFIAAHYVMGLMKVSLLLSIVGGKVFFKEEHFWQRIIGGVCITVGIVMIVLFEL